MKSEHLNPTCTTTDTALQRRVDSKMVLAGGDTPKFKEFVDEDAANAPPANGSVAPAAKIEANAASAAPADTAPTETTTKSELTQRRSLKPVIAKTGAPAGDDLTRREADEALRLAVAATRAADQALQRALLANRGHVKLSDVSSIPVADVQRSASMNSVASSLKSHKEDDIAFTGRPFGGLVADLKRRGRVYLSDWIDGFKRPLKVISSTTMLYFACLAPAIAFGALLEKFTKGDMGAIECMLSTFLCGTFNALFAGQPLLILGGTGPVAIFESIMYKVAQDILGVPFFVARFWTGVWIATILASCAVFDLCFLIKFITRFTDEIFAALISTIFVYEALKGLLYPLSHSYDNPVTGADTLKDAEHDSGSVLSILLGLGTFVCLLLLRNFRKSKFLMPQIRTLLADFSPIIAIGIMTAIDYSMRDSVTAKLTIPSTLIPSKDCRDWVVPAFSYGPEYTMNSYDPEIEKLNLYLFDNINCTWAYKTDPEKWLPIAEAPKTAVPMTTIFLCLVPASLAAVLLYLDQNITARLINKADNKLKKGPGYHLDLLVLAGVILISSTLGLPWMCAATVRSINHLFALSTKEDVIGPEGQRKEQITEVLETRLTGFAIHVLIGCSLFFVTALKFVPMAVLLGLFLTMGITSLTSIQLWERIQLLVMEPKLYPPTSYVRQVPMHKLHIFTAIQLVLLVGLFVIKRSPAGLLFPLCILLLVPIRMFLLPKIFTKRELRYLDSEEEIDGEDVGDEIIDL